MTTEMDDTVAVVHSLLLIKKHITTLSEIEDDYVAMEGERIPYAKFGFKSLQEFLQQSKKFNFSKSNGQVIVSAKLSEKDEHMAKLIREQRCDKKKKGKKTNAAPTYGNFRPQLQRRPVINKNHFITRSMQNLAQLPPANNYHHYQQQPAWSNNHNRYSGAPVFHRNQPPMVHQFNPPQQPPMMSYRVNMGQWPIPQRNNWQPPQPFCQYNSGQRAKSRDDLTAKPQRQYQQNLPKAPPAPTNLTWKPLSKEEMKPHPIVQPEIVLTYPRKTPKRAKSEENLLSDSVIIPQASPVKPPVTPKRVQYPTTKPVVQLKPSISVQSRLAVRSSPNKSKSDGCSLDSGLAMEKETNHETSQFQNDLPTIMEDNHSVAMRLHQVLLKYSTGVLEKFVPEIFKKKSGLDLPDHWPALISSYSRHFTVDSTLLAHVVYANEIPTVDEDQTLRLPWEKEQWNVYLMNVVSTTMVFGRIIGPAYSDRWNDLMTEIETWLSVSPEQKKAKEVRPQGIYIHQDPVEACVERVRCEELDSQGKRFLGYNIDTGHQEWLSIDEAFDCPQYLLSLPGQAVQFSLFGLEVLEESPHSKEITDKLLTNRTAVATVISKEDEHKEGTGISVMLWDTSKEDDVNLNTKIHNEICVAVRPPQMSVQGYTKLTVTSVWDNGVINGQVPNSGVEYVQKLIAKVVLNKERLEDHRKLKEAAEERYLVKVKESWYRAQLRMRNHQTKVHNMVCIDTGCHLSVNEADIYLLSPISHILNKYPAMAVKCRMDVKITAKSVLRMRELLVGKVSLSKLITKSEIPVVKLYQQIESVRAVICVNDTLQLESDFEACMAI